MSVSNDEYDIEMQLPEREEIKECNIKIEEGNGLFEATEIKIEECKIQIEEDDSLFEAIEKLIAQGINAGDVKKLQDDGIQTCNGLMMHSKKNLTGIEGLSESKVEKISESAEQIMNFGYMAGSDALRKRKSVERITTGFQVGERKERDGDDDEPPAIVRPCEWEENEAMMTSMDMIR